jgi:3-oxoacyl-[acyl-carrier protein] reductase
MAADDFMRPIEVAVRTTFITARAAARHMIRQRSGVILGFGGGGDPMRDYYLGGTQIAFGAIEFLRRQLATELGAHGIRVVTLHTSGIPESIPDPDLRKQITEMTEDMTILKRAATLEDVGNVAAFAASDRARTMTATALNMTCGSYVD